jgi:TRAP-type mannitol/chloroaromatic compound transport system permease small subunit
MSKITPMLRIIDNVNDWVGKIVSPLCIILMLLILIETVRRVLGHPTSWSIELTALLCGVYIVMAGVYALRYRAHVNMDILYNRFSPRGKAILDLITSIFFFAFIIVMVWKGYETTQYAIEVGERTLSRAWEPLTWPFKITIPIASFLILLQGVAKFIRDLRTATTKGETK